MVNKRNFRLFGPGVLRYFHRSHYDLDGGDHDGMDSSQVAAYREMMDRLGYGSGGGSFFDGDGFSPEELVDEMGIEVGLDDPDDLDGLEDID